MIKTPKTKCHWKDIECLHDLPYCGNCTENIPNEEKPNYKNEPKKISDYEWGMPICPTCNEPTYDNEVCFFCGQKLIIKKEK